MGVNTGIPPNWKLPLFRAAVDGSMAGNLTESQPALLVGQAFLGGDASSAAKTAPTTATASSRSTTPRRCCRARLTGVVEGRLHLADGLHRHAARRRAWRPAPAGRPALHGPRPQVHDRGRLDGLRGRRRVRRHRERAAARNAAYNVPSPVGSLALAKLFFGEGSMLERMVSSFLEGNTTQQMWCLPIPRPAAGIKAAGSISIATQQSGSGILTVYIAGQKVQVTVYQTDTQATVAANLAAAINAMTTLPVTAAVDGTETSKVNLTCRWHGLTGNDITLIPNYLGAYGGEALPVGMTLVIGAMAGGAGTPDFTAAISAIQSQQFYHFAMPYSDTASLQTWDAEVGFGPTGRWAFTRQQYGWVYNFRRDTYAGLLVWGLGQNSPVISTGRSRSRRRRRCGSTRPPTAPRAPARCSTTRRGRCRRLRLPGCLPATVDQQFSQSQRNSLVNSGLAVFGVAPSGNPMILREQRSTRRNQYGQADTAFAC